jgi:mRNA interferase MazF
VVGGLANAGWPLDCLIGDLASVGLSAPSVVRCRLFTLDRPAAPDAERVQAALARLLGSAA